MAKLELNLRVDMRVKVLSWHGYQWSHLESPSDFDKVYFGDRINFRLPSGDFMDTSYAILIEQTGRTVQSVDGENVVKCKITWLTDDGEDQETSACYIAVDKPNDYSLNY